MDTAHPHVSPETLELGRGSWLWPRGREGTAACCPGEEVETGRGRGHPLCSPKPAAVWLLLTALCARGYGSVNRVCLIY